MKRNKRHTVIIKANICLQKDLQVEKLHENNFKAYCKKAGSKNSFAP